MTSSRTGIDFQICVPSIFQPLGDYLQPCQVSWRYQNLHNFTEKQNFSPQYLLLYGLHDCTFNYFRKKASSLMLKNVPNNHNLAIIAVWILIKMELDFLPALGLAR